MPADRTSPGDPAGSPSSSGWALIARPTPPLPPTSRNANISLSCSSGSHLSFQTVCDWEGSGKTTGQWVGLGTDPHACLTHLHLALTSIPNAANASPHCYGVGTASVERRYLKSHPPFGRTVETATEGHAGVASTFPPAGSS